MSTSTTLSDLDTALSGLDTSVSSLQNGQKALINKLTQLQSQTGLNLSTEIAHVQQVSAALNAIANEDNSTLATPANDQQATTPAEPTTNQPDANEPDTSPVSE